MLCNGVNVDWAYKHTGAIFESFVRLSPCLRLVAVVVSCHEQTFEDPCIANNDSSYTSSHKTQHWHFFFTSCNTLTLYLLMTVGN